MSLRDWIHAAGRVLTRGLLHPRWREYRPMAWTYVQLYLLGKQLTEHAELVALRGLIAPGMVIADIGANAGFYTLKMASLVGPGGRIVAFEPDAFNFQLLRTRMVKARAVNVEAYQIALGERAGPAILYCSAYNRADNRLAASHTEAHVEASEVQVVKLDDFLASHDVPSISAIKIDVQGSEEHVLRGARTLLERGVRWIWLEISPVHLRGAGTDPERFLEWLDELGMDIFEVDRAGRMQPLSEFKHYLRRIGSGYGDLVMIARGGVG